MAPGSSGEAVRHKGPSVMLGGAASGGSRVAGRMPGATALEGRSTPAETGSPLAFGAPPSGHHPPVASDVRLPGTSTRSLMATISRKHLLASAAALIGGATAFGASRSARGRWPDAAGLSARQHRRAHNGRLRRAATPAPRTPSNKYFATADRRRPRSRPSPLQVPWWSRVEQLPYAQWVAALRRHARIHRTRASVDAALARASPRCSPPGRDPRARTLRVRLHRRLLASI